MHSHVYVYKFVYFIWVLGYIILAYICIQYDCGSLNSICLIVLRMSRVFLSHWSFWIDLCISKFCWMPKDATELVQIVHYMSFGILLCRQLHFRLNFQGQATSRLLHCAEGRSSQRGRDDEQQNEEHVLYRKIPVRVRSVKVMSDDAGGDDEDDDAFHMP